MKLWSLFSILSILIGLPNIIEADNSVTQIKEFPPIVMTTNESLYIDLNDYFEGNSLKFSVSGDLNLSIPQKFSQVSTQTLAVQANFISIDIPKDVSYNWAQDTFWIFLGQDQNLYFFTHDSSSFPTLTYDHKIQIPLPSINYQCKNMLRLRSQNMILVSCLPISTSRVLTATHYLISLNTTTTNQLFTERVLDGKIRSYAQFPNNDTFIITYTKSDPGCQVSTIISIYNISDFSTQQVSNILTIGADYFGLESLCVQSLQVLNETIFVADFGGGVYRVDNLFLDPPGSVASLQINDNILDMKVSLNSYYGKPTKTLVIHTQTFIYHYDWTDQSSPYPLNKYSLSPLNGELQSIYWLEITRDFISTIANVNGCDCCILAYYIGQSSPNNVYYVDKCPIIPNIVETARPLNSFFFLNTDKNTVSINQLQRSVLAVNYQNPITTNISLGINNSSTQNLQIRVIDPYDYNVYLTNSSQNIYGLAIPGSSTFDITNMFSGPLLSYTSNDTNYSVRDPFQSVKSTSNLDVIDYVLTFYSLKTSSSFFWCANDTSNNVYLQKCSVASSSTMSYDCASQQLSTEVIHSIAMDENYVYYEDGDGTISVYDINGNLQQTKLTLNNTNGCQSLIVSQSPLAPFLYCLGTDGIHFFKVDNLSLTEKFQYFLYISTPTDSIKTNQNFPSILFIKNSQAIYLVDIFPVTLGVSFEEAKISTIQVNQDNFDFSIAGHSLLIFLSDDESLIEYDISYPYSPAYIKATPVNEYSLVQFLSASEAADNFYFYAVSIISNKPFALVYRPQMSGASNYLTAIPLPNPPFNPSNPNFKFQLIPAMSKGQYEILLLPNGTQLGWSILPTVQVNFSTESVANLFSTDYEVFDNVLFTASHNGETISSSVGEIRVDLILTLENATAIVNKYHDESFKMNSGTNIISIDPRNFFNGTIYSYSLQTQEISENQSVTIVPQYYQLFPSFKNSITGIYNLVTFNGTIVAQQSNRIIFLQNNNLIPLNISNGKDTLVCDKFDYNPQTQYMLSACMDNTEQRYFFKLIQYTTSNPIQYSLIDSNQTNRAVYQIQRIIFTSNLIFILEIDQDFDASILVFNFVQPSTISYVTSITSADLNVASLSIMDFSINYKGQANQYRLYMVDPNYGLRTLDVSNSSLSFANPQAVPLAGPPNVYWNGIMTIKEQGDLSSPINLLVTSTNYKNYFLQYMGNQTIKVLSTLIPIPNAVIMNPCYADGHTFILSAYNTNNNTNYALVYSISNVASASNAQSFPILSLEYDPAVIGACSSSFDSGATAGPTFYVGTSLNISQYIVNSNITISFNGVLNSEYIIVQANGVNNQDSFQLYLVPIPDGSPSLLLVFIIVGVVALIIIIILIWYVMVKYKKRRNRIQTDSYYANLPAA